MQHLLGALAAPTHARPLHPLLDDPSAGGLHHPASDVVAGVPEGLILHPMRMGRKVSQLLAPDLLGALRARLPLLYVLNDRLYLVIEEALLLQRDPRLCRLRAFSEADVSQTPQMFGGMIKVQDLHPMGEVLGGLLPYPIAAIRHHRFLPALGLPAPIRQRAPP